MLKLEITCDEKWYAAQEAARDHNDDSLNKCITKLIGWMHENSKTKTIRISSDWGEHCFLFTCIYDDGNTGIRGGIVFHGFKGEQYKTNGSVQLTPSYGWQIHTVHNGII